MNVLKSGLLANFFGKIWLTIINFSSVPIYVKFLGVESYGMIGIYTSLLALLNLFDLGLSTTLSHELSKNSNNSSEENKRSLDLVVSLDVVYWLITSTLVLCSLTLSPKLASLWLRPDQISDSIVQQSAIFLSISVALRFPSLLYFGGLQGLRKQFSLNIISTFIETLRVFFTVYILVRFSSDIRVFFLIQIVINIIYAFSLRFLLFSSLNFKKVPSRFNKKLLKEIFGFSMSISLFSVSGAVLVQVDKIVLSRTLPLGEFGFYSLATTVGYLPHYLVMVPIYLAVFPYFSRLISQSDSSALEINYHRVTQLSATIIIPLGLILCFFPYEIMLAWVGNLDVARNSSNVVRWCSLGTMIHAIIHIPYAIQFSYGWISLAVKLNLFLILFSIPSLVVLSSYFGAAGGAINWTIINIINLLVLVPLMHRKILMSSLNQWYINDLLIPTAVMASVVAFLRVFHTEHMSVFILLIWLLFVYFVASIAGLFSSKFLRRDAIRFARNIIPA